MSESIIKTCRLCDNNNAKMCSIFDKNSEGQQIMHLMQECLSLIIFRTDPLSKQICETCLNQLEAFNKFKETSLCNANKHIKNLCNTVENDLQSVQLYLACKESNLEQNAHINIPNKNNVGTSTEDLRALCTNCKVNYIESTLDSKNEMELCTDLHQAISDSLTINKITSDGDKGMRARRRRSQAFYHELDDSLCSSLTEFTNTESSQYYEDQSEMDSYESDSEEFARPAKRRKIDMTQTAIKTDKDVYNASQRKIYKTLFNEEEELVYNPLSLMNLIINVINKQNLPDYQVNYYRVDSILPKCTYCNEEFKNRKLLALHEVDHINIELGEKVDNPTLWHESRDDAHVRNNWLNRCDESVEGEDDGPYRMDCDDSDSSPDDDLLIPIGSEEANEHKKIVPVGEIELVMGQPTINGISLSKYSKEQRKNFYKSLKVGGVTKKFCTLCRYMFKDNWAIEGHYFSLACFYSCRYCGLRFNKQRHKFNEHVQEHETLGHELSKKIYVGSKLSNAVPKIFCKNKVGKCDVQLGKDEPPVEIVSMQRPRRRNTPTPGPPTIKQEKVEPESEPPPSVVVKKREIKSVQKSATNQAYFCRKCYKVFFQLDEFNIHSKNCDCNQFPASRTKFAPSRSNGVVNETKPVVKATPVTSSPRKTGDDVTYSASGRPIRQAVRDSAPYRDGSESPQPREAEPQQNVLCFVCNTSFPTIYSRNSHMRIHKGEQIMQHMQKSTPPPANNATKPGRKSAQAIPPTFSTYIKQEPLEPKVEIYETDHKNSNSIGAVSITPISKNPNQKPTINPNIMKLVQNNPHLTIKANKSPERQLPRSSRSLSPPPPAQNNPPEFEGKTYRCSSCGQNFNNKSYLYHHKKNECTGSRYPCPFCKKRFGTESAYSSHIFYSHPE